MKANYNKPSSMLKKLSNTISQEHLQEIENSFASKHGIIPREVVYAPFNRDLARNIILDQYVNQFYSMNADQYSSTEEFKRDAYKFMKTEIESELDFYEQMCGGTFFRSRENQLFLYSNMLKENNVETKYSLKHETFHAALYDIVQGKTSKIKIYKNKNHNARFFNNLLSEIKMFTLINNRNTLALSGLGNASQLFHNYSFEENFVIHNSICSMLEDEIETTNPNIDNVISIVSSYVADSGILVKQLTDNLPVIVYGKQVPLKSYLETYINILRGPVMCYDEIDQPFASCITKTNTDNVVFEEIDSNIPDLLNELLTAYINNRPQIYFKNIINNYKAEQSKQIKTKKSNITNTNYLLNN